MHPSEPALRGSGETPTHPSLLANPLDFISEDHLRERQVCAVIDGLATDDLRAAFEVNALGLHRMTCAALPLLRASGGVVVNAGTGAATTPMEGWAAYCSSKAAARMMTLMFAQDLAGGPVQFFFLGIPPTDTVMQSEIRSAGLNPISQIPQADLVPTAVPASVMAWLCGPEARKLDEVLLDVRDDFFKSMMGARP